MEVMERARRYINRGWSVLPINPGDKQCFLPERSKLRIKENELDEYFVEPNSNIGLLLGEASGGLTDIDLDCEEAVYVGSRLLPGTLKSGRGSKVTHYWYVSPDSKSIKYTDINGDTILEIRSDNHQTVVEPSIHPSGDRYVWDNPDTDPLTITRKIYVGRRHVSRLVLSWPGTYPIMADTISPSLMPVLWCVRLWS